MISGFRIRIFLTPKFPDSSGCVLAAANQVGVVVVVVQIRDVFGVVTATIQKVSRVWSHQVFLVGTAGRYGTFDQDDCRDPWLLYYLLH